MPVALETFLSQLSDSGILSDQKLRTANHKKSEHQDGESLAKDMIKSGHLTKYQAEQILSGKGKNLCMGQYVLLEKLGAGGMGQVYKAYHPGMERLVAIKVILTKGKIDEESVRRFEREVKAAAKLSHPNIITVYDAGNANGRHFMVMELVKGQDLNVIVHRKGTLGVSETINYIKQVARGLAFAHESGVIHRDIKPANLFLDIKGNVKILDMGLAKISARENEETLSMLTGTTAIMGTVDFMSPEQGLSSRDVDARADIYSLGATLYYFLTKKVMYEGDTAFAKVIAHSESPIPSLKAIRPDVSDNLDLIYTKMVAKQVEDRYQSMLELIQDLDAIEKGSASTKNLTELSTIYSLRNELGEMDVSRVSSKKVIQSSKSNKAIVEKDYKFALIATGIGLVLSGVVALAFILGRSSNSKNEVASKSNIENEEEEIVTTNGSAENIKSEGSKDNSEKTTPLIIVQKSTAPKPDPAEVFKFAKQIILEPPFLESKIKDAQKVLSKILNCETEHQLVLSPNVKMFFSLIPSGKFIKDFDPRIYRIPSNKEEFIDYPFLIGKNTVTQEQWNAVMGVKTTNFQPGKIQDLGSPQTFVSWNDCQEFVKVLNQKTNGGYRLPEDLEWDYVFKVDPFGNNQNALNPPGMPYFPGIPRATPGIGGTTGSYKPNVFGLYGGINPNLSEWCENVHLNYQNPFPIDKQAKEKLIASSGTNSIRAMRSAPNGMGWTSNTINGSPASMRNFNYTFRIVKTIIPDTDEKIVKAVLSKVLAMVEKDLVLIPAGTFLMGSPTTEVRRKNDETQHQVTLTKPFYMGKYEVTQEQWEGVMGSNPSSRIKGEKLPVTNVSWEDCQEFIKKLNTSAKGGFRLPTESEWEYACRAGTSTAYSVGESITKEDANYDVSITKAVGSYKPNAFGLFDMHGNVWEWCEDWSAAYTDGGVTNPKGAATGTSRVLRGGAFLTDISGTRSSFRNYDAPSGRFSSVGFRLARTVDVKTAVAPTLPKPDPAEVMPVSGNLLLAPFTEAKAKEVQKEVAKSLQKEVEEKEDLGKGIKLEMVLIPAGKFIMGSPTTEVGRNKDETQHEVTLTKPYYLGKHEVTQDQWQAVMGNNPSSIKGPRLPVTNVSWNDCQDFINNLNTKTNRGYRLPTDAEWEYACRAGTTTAYSVEDKIIPLYANYNKSGKGKPTPAASFKPNAFGLYDMHGNVWEWCEDWKADYPEKAVTDPKGPPTGKFRVLRGGSYDDDVSITRSSLRNYDTRFTPSDRLFNRGFRLAMTP